MDEMTRVLLSCMRECGVYVAKLGEVLANYAEAAAAVEMSPGSPLPDQTLNTNSNDQQPSINESEKKRAAEDLLNVENNEQAPENKVAKRLKSKATGEEEKGPRQQKKTGPKEPESQEKQQQRQEIQDLKAQGKRREARKLRAEMIGYECESDQLDSEKYPDACLEFDGASDSSLVSPFQ